MSHVKLNINELTLFIVLALMHNFFYLLPDNIGPISYYDIEFILCVAFSFYIYTKGTNVFFSGHFKILVLLVPVLIILSSLAANLNYNQNILSGILTQRAWFATMLLYFALYYYVRNEKINYEIFCKVLNTVVIIELVLYFTQYFVGEDHMFLTCMYNFRYGSIRLYCSTNYMTLASMIAMENLLHKNKIKISIIISASTLAYIIIVNKGRGALVAFMIALAAVFVFSRHSSKLYKFLVGAIVILIAARYLVTSTAFQEVFDIIFKGKFDGTYNVRVMSQEFYLNKWHSSLISTIFGYGYPNGNSAQSVIESGENLGYLLADNGIYGFIYCYGLIGIIWYVSYFFKVLLSCYKVFKEKSAVPYVKLILAIVTISTDITMFFVYNSFNMILTLILCEILIKERNRGQHEDVLNDFEYGG